MIRSITLLCIAVFSWPALAQTEDAQSQPAQVNPETAIPGQDPDLEPASNESPLAAQQLEPADWVAYGRTVEATRYSPLDAINTENVGQLTRAWVYRSGDMPPESVDGKWAPENTPLKVGTALYLCTPRNIMVSLDAASGRERWRYDPNVTIDNIPYSASCRGVSFYEQPGAPDDALCKRRVIEGTLDARLIAVDADTGQLCPEFGDNGQVDLLQGMGESVPGFVAVTSPPTIVRGVAVVGHQVLDGQKEDAPSGVIRGYDAVTGELAWAWDMGRPGKTGRPEGDEVYTRGTPNAWTIFAGDEELGMVYVPMGNSSVDYWAGNRRDFENRFSTALVALDATSGEVRWEFQTVHKDLWDYDLGSQPTLLDFPTGNGGTTPAVILPTKQGDIFVFDRATGEPLTEVVERPVPQSELPNENAAPTQPFSIGMPTLAKPELTGRDTWGLTPLDQLWCRIQFHQASYEGRYTPPTVERSFIQYPGYNGGNDWGSGSLDPERGIFVANYNNIPMYDRLIHRDEANKRGMVPVGQPGGTTDSGGGVPQAGSPYAVSIKPWRNGFTGMPCTRPPFGGIMAIDIDTREVLWDVPLGTARANGPFGIPSRLPVVIGTPNNGGSVITAGGLIFIAAATDNQIRAIDIETGDVLWEDELPAGGQATPMTFEADGRQYLVINAGGHHFMETPIGDYFIAYSLPTLGETESTKSLED